MGIDYVATPLIEMSNKEEDKIIGGGAYILIYRGKRHKK